MIENTSLSTPQSPNVGDGSSNTDSTAQPVKATWLSDIPLLKPQSSTSQEKTPLLSEPVLCESEPTSLLDESPPKFEYEFTNLWDGCLYSVYLYDTTDLSACERILNRPVNENEITYSGTGNGFITDGEFKYTFCKNPYRRISANSPQVSFESKLHRRQSIRVRTADDIMASI